MSDSLRILVNPSAGGGRGRRYVRRLGEWAVERGVGLGVSRDVGHLRRLAREAVEEGVERLLVAGGDGTLHHVVQELAGTACALAPLPVGRGNDLAATLESPGEIDAVLRQGAAGETRAMDLGRLVGARRGRADRSRVAGESPATVPPADRFAVYCGVGFDSEAARWVTARPHLLKGPPVYAQAVLRTLVRFVPPEIEVEHDDGTFRGRAMFVVAANCPRFGGGMRIAPEAEVDDGLLDLVIVREVSRRALLAVFPRVYRGTHVDHPAVEIVRTRRARIRLDREMEMYADGEPFRRVGSDGVELAVQPAALRVAGT